jgi:glycosyltransferase involved in cell wall biosynthesis
MANNISVALPAYKSRYLEKAIKSILKQTFVNYELIIVNDASPEDIDSIVKKYKDERIRYYVNSKNLGKESVVKNWNKCLEYAQYEYFVMFSDDDEYEPDYFEKMIHLAERYPKTNIFHSRVKQIDENGQIISFTPSCPEWETGINFIWHRLSGLRLQYAPDFFIRTDAIRKIGGFIDFPLAWGSDDATWFYLSINGGIGYLNQPLVGWRNSPQNISSIGNFNQKFCALNNYHNWLLKFFKHIEPKDETDILLLCELDKVAIKRIEVLKTMTLLKYGQWSKYGLFAIVCFWIKYKNQYDISFSILIKASLYYLNK